MNQVRKVIDNFWGWYVDLRGFPDLESDDFYVVRGNEIITYSSLVEPGVGLAPVFSPTNVGELKKWTQVYPGFEDINQKVVLVAAFIYEQSGIRNRKLSDEEIFNTARLILQVHAGIIPADFLEIYNEIINESSIFNPESTPYLYRKCGLVNKITGAVFDLTGKRDANDKPIVDYQDLFVALIGVTNSMFCPNPVLYYNATDKINLNASNINEFYAIIDGMSLSTDCGKLILQGIGQNNLPPTKVIKSIIEKIKNALIKHKIINEGDGSYKYSYTSSIFFQTRLPINTQIIYAASILFASTHGHKFYINELTNYALARQNNVLYYRHDVHSQESHVMIEKRIEPSSKKARSPFPSFSFWKDNNLQLYKLSIDYIGSDNGYISIFEKDFYFLLLSIAKRIDDIIIIYSLLEANVNVSCQVMSAPTMSKFTKMFTNKKDSMDDCVSANERPLYVPINYADGLGLSIAKFFVFQFFGDGHRIYAPFKHIYVSSSNAIVELNPNVVIDNFSAYYISDIEGYPIIGNKSQEKNIVIPYISTGENVVRPLVPNYQGLSVKGTWISEPLYQKNINLYQVMQYLHPDIFTAENFVKFLQQIDSDLNKFANLCRCELFDHKNSEIIKTFSTPDSFIHFRLFELFVRRRIIFVKQAAREKKDRNDRTIQLEVEIPRHAGVYLENIDSEADCGLVIFKYYYNGQWQYEPLMYSNCGTNIPNSVMKEIKDQYFYLYSSVLNFSQNKIKPITINTCHFTLLAVRHNIISQVINSDGHCTSIMIKDNIGGIIQSLCILAGQNPPPITNVPPEIYKLEICFKDFMLPLSINNSSTEFGDLPPRLLDVCFTALTSFNIQTTKDGNCLTISENIFVPYNNCPLKNDQIDQEIIYLDYQRPITVLLALIDWCLLQHIPDDPDDAANKLIPIIQGRQRAAKTEILVSHRFVPDIVRGDLETLFSSCINMYFNSLPMMNENTYQTIYNFIVCEAKWLIDHRDSVKPTDIRYIEGIHYLPTDNIMFPLYESAKSGKESITQTVKQYEYAVSRYAARKNMTSWTNIPDLSHATTAAMMENYSVFVYRFSSGTVMYGFQIESDNPSVPRIVYARDLVTKITGQPAGQVLSFANFATTSFTTDCVYLFCTSGNINQGTLYRIHIFVPKQN